MSTPVNRTLGACGVALFALSLMLSSPRHVDADSAHPTDVRVVNTPLPVTTQGVSQVTGSVAITGTPTVNALQSGSWTVGVGSLPNVRIDPAQNTVQLPYDASNPLPVRDANSERQPWSFLAGANFAVNSAGVFCDTPAYQVPQGKRLVVTQIGIEGGLPSGQKLLAFMFRDATRTAVPAPLFDDSFGFASFALTQQIETYLESGQSFWCGAARVGGGGTASIDLNFSGYLVTKG